MAPSIPETIRVLLPGGAVRRLPLEEYVLGVVSAALPADAHLEALKAQAVAARTFGAITRRHIERGSDVCTLRHCQVWKEVATASALKAAEETRGIVAIHNGRLIDAYYFEHCGGNTRDATGILIQVPPYLQSVSCPCGFATLKGHGIGMCQRGAQVMARFGDTYDVILKHYFNGITLDRAVVIPVPVPEAPLSYPTATQAHEPEAPSQGKTREGKMAPRPGKAKKNAAPSPTPGKPIDYIPSPPPTADIPSVETAKGLETLSARPSESTWEAEPPEAPVVAPVPTLEPTLQTESREIPEIVLATPAPESALHPETQEAPEVLPAPPALESKLEAESLIPPEILPPAMRSVESALPAVTVGTTEIVLAPPPESVLTDESLVALEVAPTAMVSESPVPADVPPIEMQSESAPRLESQETLEVVLTPPPDVDAALRAASQAVPLAASIPPQTESILAAETATGIEVHQSAPLPESTLRAEPPIGAEPIPTPASKQSPTLGSDVVPVQVNAANTQEQDHLLQAAVPAAIELPPQPAAVAFQGESAESPPFLSSPAEAAAPTLSQPERTASPPESTQEVSEEEPSWYPTAEEMSLGAGAYQPALIDELLETLVETAEPFGPGSAQPPDEALTPATGVAPSGEGDLAPRTQAEEFMHLPSPPESMPEEMPVFPIESLTTEPQALLPPSPPESMPEQLAIPVERSVVEPQALLPPSQPESVPEQTPVFPIESLTTEPQALLPPSPPESVPEQMQIFPVESPSVEPQGLVPPPAPESMPEQMPVFPVESPSAEPRPQLPLPPLHEEELLDNLSAAPPSQVLIDRLPGPRMIVGDVAKPGIIVTIRDAVGHSIVLVSGAAPRHGPGGFEAPLSNDGTYDVTFDHHALQVHLNDETIVLQLSS